MFNLLYDSIGIWIADYNKSWVWIHISLQNSFWLLLFLSIVLNTKQNKVVLLYDKEKWIERRADFIGQRDDFEIGSPAAFLFDVS